MPQWPPASRHCLVFFAGRPVHANPPFARHVAAGMAGVAKSFARMSVCELPEALPANPDGRARGGAVLPRGDFCRRGGMRMRPQNRRGARPGHGAHGWRTFRFSREFRRRLFSPFSLRPRCTGLGRAARPQTRAPSARRGFPWQNRTAEPTKGAGVQHTLPRDFSGVPWRAFAFWKSYWRGIFEIS